MATAKKTTRKKSVKPPVVDTSKFFSTSLTDQDEKKKTKSSKPTSHFSTDAEENELSLSELADQWVAASTVEKVAKRKASEARSVLSKFLLSDFARRWVSEKARPETRTWKSLTSSFNYVMTSKITMTTDKQEAIEEELDIDMSEHMEVTGFQVDLKQLQDNPESMKAFVSFLETLSQEEPETTKVVKKMLKLKSSFFNSLYEICGKNEGRLSRMLDILKPQANFASVGSQFAEEHIFNLVRDMEG